MKSKRILIGRNLQKAIKKKKITQRELASMIGRTEGLISYYCSDKRTPNISTICLLTEALGVSVDYLLYGEDKRKIKATKPTTDDTMVSVEDVLDAIRDMAMYPGKTFVVEELLADLERRLMS